MMTIKIEACAGFRTSRLTNANTQPPGLQEATTDVWTAVARGDNSMYVFFAVFTMFEK